VGLISLAVSGGLVQQLINGVMRWMLPLVVTLGVALTAGAGHGTDVSAALLRARSFGSVAPTAGVVVYAQAHGYIKDIVAANADGSGERNLTPDHGSTIFEPQDGDPVVSADGTKVAFVREGDESNVIVMNAEGGNRHRVGVNGADNLAWSPDSQSIA
jgi:hypothetical protein